MKCWACGKEVSLINGWARCPCGATVTDSKPRRSKYVSNNGHKIVALTLSDEVYDIIDRRSNHKVAEYLAKRITYDVLRKH